MATTRKAFCNQIFCESASDLPTAGKFSGQIAWINSSPLAIKRWSGSAWVSITPSFGLGNGRYDPDQTPSAGLDANSSDEFIGTINTGIQTWGNQGSAAITAELDTLRLSVPATAGVSRRCLWYTPPSGTDWVMSTRVSGAAFTIHPTPSGMGLCVLETGTIATPTSLSFGLHQRSSSTNMSWGFYSSTSYTAAYTLIGVANTISTLMVVGPPVWLQMRYVNSSKGLSYWISFDGFNFGQTGTTRTLGAHPVNIGIFGDDNTANAAVDFRFHYLRTRTNSTGTTSPYPVG